MEDPEVGVRQLVGIDMAPVLVQVEESALRVLLLELLYIGHDPLVQLDFLYGYLIIILLLGLLNLLHVRIFLQLLIESLKLSVDV